MSIIGIGTDIVSVPRIKKLLDLNRERFLDRILSAEEKKHLPNDALLTHYVAKRFAAKEAFAKALATGIADGLSFSQISILNHDNGQPYVVCTGQAKALLGLKKITTTHISLSDEADYAVAFVILI